MASYLSSMTDSEWMGRFENAAGPDPAVFARWRGRPFVEVVSNRQASLSVSTWQLKAPFL